MRLVLGVDQSYTGFATSIQYPGDIAKHETTLKSFPAAKFDNDLHRLAHIRNWFIAVLLDHKPDLVVMEGYAAAAKYGRESAGELGAVVKLAVLEHRGMPPLVVAPTRLKKWVTGRGNAKKSEMLLGVYKRWGEEFTDDNKADAYSLGRLGMALRYAAYEGELTKPQNEVLSEIRKAW